MEYRKSKARFFLENFGFNLIRLIFLLFFYRKLNSYLKKLADATRKHFKGKITYASGFWEKVDWNIFDIVSINEYPTEWNKGIYSDRLRDLKRFGKPVAITEFGCACYEGAADEGANGGWLVLKGEWPKKEIRINLKRSEDEQANYIKNLLEFFKKKKIYAAFVYTFLENIYTHSKNPKKDLDVASFNVIKIYEDGHIEPKKSFFVIKNFR
jgi:hypothetical protein